MNALLVFCMICWLFAALTLRWVVDDPEMRERFETADREAGHSPQDRWKPLLLTVLFGPLWVPYAIVATLLCCGRELMALWKLRNSHRTFHEYRFTEINYYEQSPETRAAFDWATEGTMPLTFRLVGDYQLKTEPVTVLDRFFWSSDDTTWCSCCRIPELHEPDERSIEFDTLLSDGTHIATATVDEFHPDTPATAEKDRLQITFVPNLSIEEALSRHIREVHRVATEQGLEILQFEKDQLESLVIYDQRLFHQWLHRSGHSVEPPAPELPPAKGRLTVSEYLLTNAAGGFDSAENDQIEELTV